MLTLPAAFRLVVLMDPVHNFFLLCRTHFMLLRLRVLLSPECLSFFLSIQFNGYVRVVIFVRSTRGSIASTALSAKLRLFGPSVMSPKCTLNREA
eukprot:3386122-Pleurochrysis_carterae.AAC.4